VLTIAEEEKKRIELGLPDPKAEPVGTFNHNVITRPMLRLPESKHGGSDRERITIMTYNVLAQSLIRRRLFPTSGTNIANSDRNKLILCRRHTKMEKPVKDVNERINTLPTYYPMYARS
jgi:hypothetical protein